MSSIRCQIKGVSFNAKFGLCVCNVGECSTNFGGKGRQSGKDVSVAKLRFGCLFLSRKVFEGFGLRLLLDFKAS